MQRELILLKSNRVDLYKLSKEKVIDIYWDHEITISILVAKYKKSRPELFSNRGILSDIDREKLTTALWGRVNCLQRLNIR